MNIKLLSFIVIARAVVKSIYMYHTCFVRYLMGKAYVATFMVPFSHRVNMQSRPMNDKCRHIIENGIIDDGFRIYI